MPVSSDNKRIAINTLMLYVRMFIVMGVSIYISRLVLATLGIVDFGIYNVVGGIVAIFSFLQTVMASSVQRFITFELGSGDYSKLKEIFNSSFQIHVFMALLIVLLAETVGFWFLNTKMEIPVERMTAANIIYQISIITCVMQIIMTPFVSTVTAHEKISAFSYLSVFDVSLRLLLVIALSYLNGDKLIYYGIIVLIIFSLDLTFYFVYARRSFSEVRFSCVINYQQLKKIGSFAGWSMFGNLAYVLSTQGVNIILNIFFGPTVNAARAVTTQVQSAITSFVYNFQIATTPQITKSYAASNYHRMYSLIFASSKLSFYLLLIVALPLFLEMPFVLGLWLKEVPEHTVMFARILLVYMMIDSISGGMATSVNATGKIRNYQIVMGGITMLAMPAAYVLLNLGMPPEIVYVTDVCIIIICQTLRILMVLPMIGLPYYEYLKNVVFKIITVAIISIPLSFVVFKRCDSNFMGLLLVCFFCTAIILPTIYLVGINQNERLMINNMITEKINNIIKQN